VGWLDRLHKVVTGIGGGLQAVPGLAWDLSRAPFVDDDTDGILGTINASVTSRVGQLFGNLVGPEEGLGAVIGAVPGREHLRGPVHAVTGGLETAYREGVGEPLSTAFTAGSLATSDRFADQQGHGTGIGGQFAALFDPDTWQAADHIAEHRSPGQAMAIMFATKDVLDQDEVERFQGTDIYRTVSGTGDALTRFFLSPDVLAGKSLTALRAGRLAEIGEVTARAPVQFGARAERLGSLALGSRSTEAITRINEAIDRAWVRLPAPLQAVTASERTFAPSDVERLTRLEVAQRELRTGQIESRIAASSDPNEVALLSNIAEQRRAREARIAAGEVPADVGAPVQRAMAERAAGTEVGQRFNEQIQADVDAYFAASSGPTPKGFYSRITQTNGWHQIDGLIDKLPDDVDTRAGLIRDRLFPTHHRGDIISHYLAEAAGPAEREAVMRVFLGDMRALDGLDASNYALGQRLRDLTFEQAAVRSEAVLAPARVRGGTLDDLDQQLSLFGEDATSPFYDDYRNVSERLARIGEEMDGVVSEATRNDRLRAAFQSLPAGPRVTAGSAIRSRYKSSSFFQTSTFGKGVRLISDMRPHHLVDAGGMGADSQLSRMLREAGYDDTAIAQARGQFMALDPQTRGASLERWVRRIEHKVLSEGGLDDNEIAQVLTEAHLGKNQAKSYIRGSKFDGEGRARVRFHDGDEMVDMEMPLTVTQLENVVPIPNFAILRKHVERYSRLKYGDDWRGALARGAKPAWEAKEYGLDAMRGIMEVWRPAVLLRPAWTMRVVGDELLRQVAKFGALSVMLEARQNLHNYGAALKESPLLGWAIRHDPITDEATARGFRAAAAGAALGSVGGPMGAVAGGALGNRIVRKLAEADEVGYKNIRFGGHNLSGPFGDAGTTAEWYRAHVSAGQSVDDLFGRHEARWLGVLRRDPSSYRTHLWGESEAGNAAYRVEWTNSLRHQISQDAMARQFLAGKSPDEVLDWLDNTLEGRQYAALVPWRHDHEAWVDAVAGQVEAYTGGLDEVKLGILGLPDKASDARVTKLLDLIPEDRRAPIHGAETEQLLAKSKLNQAVNFMVNNTFDALGTMATDALSRNPTFHRFYQSEVRRLFARRAPGRIAETDLKGLEGQARDFALRETRELLYDLAEQSRFGSMTRLLMPFYNAWQEVLTRWAGLAMENPAGAARARMVYGAPDKLGWTYTDDQGNDYLRFRIPEFARGLINQGPFKSALDSQGYIFMDKGGFNLVAQGTPGFGPFVQMAASKVVRQNPDLESSLRFILPFGPVDGIEALLPPTVKRAFDATSGEDSAARSNAEGRILTTHLANMQTGKEPMVNFSDPAARAEFLGKVSDEADQLMKLRFFTGYVAPVAPLYESPYKPYIDVYRALRDGDWKRARRVGEQYDLPGAEGLPTSAPAGDSASTADDIFIDSFGEEFFALTQAFTKTVNGVPPTVEGLEAGEKFSDLIASYPEWGGVIAGYDGGGTAVQFSRAVYDRQMGSGQRRRLTPDEVLDGPSTRLGWARYSRYMDMIDSIRMQRGLPNMQVKAAEDLRQVKRLVIAGLASKYPAWFNDYSQTDRNAWVKRIDGARRMVERPGLKDRPDMRGLSDYLRARDAVEAVLRSRESHSLTATDNQDVAVAWSTIVSAIVERNPAFADLYYRKLENDPVLDANAMLVSMAGQEV